MSKLYKIVVTTDFLVCADNEKEAVQIAKDNAEFEWEKAKFVPWELTSKSLLTIEKLQSIPYGANCNKTAFKLFLEANLEHQHE